jgi:hypothetical protein
MAYFAEIDKNHLVVRILVIDNSLEHRGPEFLSNELNLGGTWIQTSFNTIAGIHYTDGIPSEDQTKALRGNYAGIGFTYDPDLDAFLPPKPFDSWTLDEITYQWTAPVDYPDDGQNYQWDDSIVNWTLIQTEGI